MSDDLANARADLAFLRTIAEGDPRPSPHFGLVLMSAGLFYGFETLIHWAGASGVLPVPAWLHLAAAIGGTGGFLVCLVIILWRDRNRPKGTTARKAYETAFQATGMMNVTMVFVFGYNAFTTGNFVVWMYYVPVVFAIQGGAWFVAAQIQKRAWYGAVAIGWFIAAAALGVTIGQVAFSFVAAVALFGLMALPGFVLWQLAKAPD